MTYNNTNKGDETEFNSNALKIMRLNEERNKINLFKMNPKVFNNEYMEFNFNLWFKCLNNYHYEIAPKLTDEETKAVDEMKKGIEECFKKYPIIQQNNNGKMKFNEAVWNIIKRFIEKYEQKLYECADVHGFEMTNKKDMRKAIIDM